MGPTDFIPPVIVTFCASALYAIHASDRRKRDRRMGVLFAPINRRGRDRRKLMSLSAHLAWAFQAQVSRFKRKPKPFRRHK